LGAIPARDTFLSACGLEKRGHASLRIGSRAVKIECVKRAIWLEVFVHNLFLPAPLLNSILGAKYISSVSIAALGTVAQKFVID